MHDDATSPLLNAPEIRVCIAAYNGERYIAEQIASILAQIGPDDEVVVVDDCSTDGTAAVVDQISDPRVKLFRQTRNRGYVQAFGAAMAEARGEYILLADQDDLWAPGRVEVMVDALRAGADVVATNLATMGGPDYVSGPYRQVDWRLRERDSRRRLRNLFGTLIGAMSYWGCAMGLRRETLALLLPFPKYLTESHDLWIAIYGNLARSIKHLEFRSVYWRNHATNTNPKKPRGLWAVLKKRWMMARAIMSLHWRLRRLR